MLKKLQVSNYAIIDEVVLEFDDKLTIITGETGAGKSILLGALSLMLGHRATDHMFFEKNRKCVVEGHFDLENHDLKAFFKEADLDFERETIIRREITSAGKSRAFVNDTPVQLTVLKKLTRHLIQLLAQHQTLSLGDHDYQQFIVDSVAGHMATVELYRLNYEKLLNKRRSLQQLRDDDKQLKKEMDYVLFQLEELNKANIQDPGEQEKLEGELKKFEHAELIESNTEKLLQLTGNSKNSIASNIRQAESLLEGLQEMGDDYKEWKKRLASVRLEVEDIYESISSQNQSGGFDPKRSNELQIRLDTLLRLQSKHSVISVEDLLKLRGSLEAKSQSSTNLENDIHKLEIALEKDEKQLRGIAETISRGRKKSIPKLEKQLNKLLDSVGMANAIISVETNANPEKALGPNGIESLYFLFSPNKGVEKVELKKIASGGELSRIMLVLQSLIAHSSALPTLIFDEIDTGISGDVAIKVGKALQKLSKNHQLICITHLPQIASTGEKHYKVFKADRAGRTESSVQLLNKKERLLEIGTILSGKPPGKEALANAKELMNLMK